MPVTYDNVGVLYDSTDIAYDGAHIDSDAWAWKGTKTSSTLSYASGTWSLIATLGFEDVGGVNNTQTINHPAGTQIGDLMIVTRSQVGAIAGDLSGEFTALFNRTSGTSNMKCWNKIVGSETSFTSSTTGNHSYVSSLAVYRNTRGMGLLTTNSGEQADTTTTTLTIPSQASALSNALGVYCLLAGNTITAPAGVTRDIETVISIGTLEAYIAHEVASGNFPSRNFTVPATNGVNMEGGRSHDTTTHGNVGTWQVSE